MREYDAADSLVFRDTSAFGERTGHGTLKKLAILWYSTQSFEFVLNSFGCLRREGILKIEWVTHQRVAWQCAL